MNQSFKKQHRLLLPSDYNVVFGKKQRLVTPFFVLFYQRHQGLCSRLGLAISKKAVRSAVTRNQLKRISRESFRCAEWPTPFDVVVVAKKGSLTKNIDKSAVRTTLDHAWTALLKRV